MYPKISCNYQIFFYSDLQNNYAKVGDVFLDTSLTSRYFKLTPNFKYYNEGEWYAKLFKKTSQKNFIDIGSNIGEISAQIAKTFPKAKIISVEGNKENAIVQKRNFQIKLFSFNVFYQQSISFMSQWSENFFIIPTPARLWVQKPLHPKWAIKGINGR